jgi:hypothetical protein
LCLFTKQHKYIGFLKKKHVEIDKITKKQLVYDLPCCFVREKHIPSDDPRFKRINDALKAPMTAAERLTQEEADEDAVRDATLQKSLQQRIQEIVNYESLSYTFSKKYVLGPEKYPLEAGKIGVPSIELDKYFGQDSTKQVTQIASKQMFKSNIRGFYRMGVMAKTTKTQMSLFAALAPSLNLNTPAEVAQ